jgi:hypothetical protein
MGLNLSSPLDNMERSPLLIVSEDDMMKVPTFV